MKQLNFFFTFFLLIGFISLHAQNNDFNCYTIVAGKDATKEGHILLAHNEDDHGENLVNWFKVPGQVHEPNETVTLQKGAEVSQVDTTYEYLWLQMPGMKFADSYMNKYGVTIASNACASREDDPELTEGGIGYWLRRLMAERAATAKEAVQLGGTLVEKYGYASSGRTYTIADPNEAWVMSVVNGKHWVAQRVPDDKVMIIPNYYTITNVNLSNKETFMGSEDLISYAQERGWYNPETDGVFNFRKVYGHPRSLASDGNIPRKWRGLELLTGKSFDMEKPLPFATKPFKKISIQDMMEVLGDHYEGTEWDESQLYEHGEPHSAGVNSICAPHNQYGFVTELRNDMPIEIGAVMWLAPRRPCIQPYIPWYLGINKIPENFALTDHQTALKNHFDAPENIFAENEGHAFVKYAKFADHIDENYGKYIENIIENKLTMQENMIKKQKEIEKKALNLYPNDKDTAMEVLFDLTNRYLQKTKEQMERVE